MGRRSRRRSAALPTTTATGPGHPARVRVAEDVWQDFKLATAGGAISRALGELVEEEVGRYRARQLADGHATGQEVLDALARAEELAERLRVIVSRLVQLHGRPPRA